MQQIELIDKVIVFALQKGDQELWNILYPYLQEHYKDHQQSVIKMFAQIIGE